METNKLKEIQEYIVKFYKYVIVFNNVLADTYKMDIDPTYNEAGRYFPKKGLLESKGVTYDYHYHGSGCTLIINGHIELDYNIDVLHDNQIKITDWKLYDFIKTISNGITIIDIDNLSEILIELAQQGLLIRQGNSLTYNINDSYFK